MRTQTLSSVGSSRLEDDWMHPDTPVSLGAGGSPKNGWDFLRDSSNTCAVTYLDMVKRPAKSSGINKDCDPKS